MLNKLVGAELALEQDAQLMLQVRAGDDASFDLLLRKYRCPIVGYLTRMVRNQAVAEELAQEVFLRVYKARSGYEPSAKFATWLYRIASRVALNAIRDRKAESGDRSLDEPLAGGQPVQPADSRPTREQELVAEARLAAVRQAIAALPGNQRSAVLLHKYHELDYSQIAAALGCSVSSVKSLLFRAYGTLRSRLEEVPHRQHSRQTQVTR